MLKTSEIKIRIENELIGICLTELSYTEEILSKLIFDSLEESNRSIYLALSKTDFKTISSPDHLRQILNDRGFTLKTWYIAASMLCPHDELVNEKLMAYHDSVMAISAYRLMQSTLQQLKVDSCGLDIITELKQKLEEISSPVQMFRNELSFYEEYNRFLARIIDEQESPDAGPSLKSVQYPSFTRCTCGLRPGNIVTIAGAIKQGKTTFGIQLLLDFVLGGEASAGIFSLEMTREELARKIMGIKAGINNRKLRDPAKLESADIGRLHEAKEKFGRGSILICDSIFNETLIRARTKQWIRNHNVKVIMIDYIGLVDPLLKPRDGESRERQMAYLSVYFKNMAKELDIVIILLAQLNRQGINDPKSSNLADTIAIARDSDFLFTIHKPSDQFKTSVTIGSRSIEVKENHFLVTLSNSRHTRSGSTFVLEMTDTGELRELSLTHA